MTIKLTRVRIGFFQIYWLKRLDVTLMVFPIGLEYSDDRGRGVIVFELGKKGLEPLTLRLSGAYSYLLSYLPLAVNRGYICYFLTNQKFPILHHIY